MPPAAPERYTLSLHDALPIWDGEHRRGPAQQRDGERADGDPRARRERDEQRDVRDERGDRRASCREGGWGWGGGGGGGEEGGGGGGERGWGVGAWRGDVAGYA